MNPAAGSTPATQVMQNTTHSSPLVRAHSGLTTRTAKLIGSTRNTKGSIVAMGKCAKHSRDECTTYADQQGRKFAATADAKPNATARTVT